MMGQASESRSGGLGRARARQETCFTVTEIHGLRRRQTARVHGRSDHKGSLTTASKTFAVDVNGEDG